MINCKHSLKIKKISSAKDKDFSHLQQIYEKEFAPITSYKVNQDGLFDQDFLISTWSKHGYEIYLLEIKEEAVGFAVVNLASMIDLDTNTRDIAEFFVMPQLRNQRIGSKFAQEIFKLYPGQWEVRQLESLTKARKFWLRAIQNINPKNFCEENNNPKWQGYLQKFTI